MDGEVLGSLSMEIGENCFGVLEAFEAISWELFARSIFQSMGFMWLLHLEGVCGEGLCYEARLGKHSYKYAYFFSLLSPLSFTCT